MYNPSLTAAATKLRAVPGQLGLLWPSRATLYCTRSFERFDGWLEVVTGLSLTAQVPVALGRRWARVQITYLSAWVEPDLLTVGDLVAFTALEYAVQDRYGHLASPRPKYNAKRPDAPPGVSFAKALDYMVTGDGLTDDKLPFVRRYGGTVVPRLRMADSVKPTLPDMRNHLAHGDPMERGPGCGLFELIRDLIDYAYRDWPD